MQFQKVGAVAKRPDFMKVEYFFLKSSVEELPFISLVGVGAVAKRPDFMKVEYFFLKSSVEELPFISLVGVFCNHPDK